MEKIIEYFLVGIITVLGLIMFLFPTQSTKQEFKSSEQAVAKTKRNGLVLAIIGVVALAVLIFANSQI